VLMAAADKSDIIFWSIILLVALIVMFGVVTYIRKWMNQGESTATGFTLSDLRQLHKQGKMSTAEYESAKAILIGGMKKEEAAAKAAPKEGPRTSPPGFDIGPSKE
jgi:hypothetical protein